ncbi:Ig-like domain-containing protein [Sagittula sp. SSi028]|uniref:Ig-like domain-containing protein n=1 Tax=Sagittula sp. SSi028 TaxID=3400636 RepID=UPI003AF4BB96
MMNAIDFVIRTSAGTVERGSVGGDEQGFLLQAGYGNDISLNLSQSDLRGYDRAADDLLITLADGRVIVLENYFSPAGAGATNSRLFLSANGNLNEVSFVEAEGGALFAQYGPTESWGKWSPSEQLIFVDDPEVMPRVAGDFTGDGEEASMAAALPLLGLGGAGAGVAAGGAGALLGLPLLIGGSGNGSDGSDGDDTVADTPVVDTPTDTTPDWIAPTVNAADTTTDIGGADAAVVTVTGTANPGSTVAVTVGDTTLTGEADENSEWEVVFDDENFPEDGVYEDVTVVVTDPNGTVTELDGPSFVIDTTPPAIDVTEGTVTVGEVVNAEEHQNGVTVNGTGEADATLTVTVGEYSETTTIAEDGTWSFTFDETVFAEGEYTTDITLEATDAFGNSTVVTDSVQVDTVNMVTLDNGPLTGDDLISAGEHAAGVTLSGTTQAGSTVEVTIEGVTQTATADADGLWSVTFGAADLPEGVYQTTAMIVSTDAAGNASTLSHTFDVDTEATVTIDTSGVAADGMVNASEFSSEITLVGTGEPGASLVISSGGNTLGTTVVGADGAWSLAVMPSMLAISGDNDSELGYTSTVDVVSTDGAGNVSGTSGEIRVDTSTSVIGMFDDGNQIINASERADGVSLSGGAEPGAAITVSVGGSTLTTTAGADGAWSVDIPTALIPEGETTLGADVVSTDLAGNVATASMSIAVDTITGLTMDTASVGTDGTVNANERSDGVTVTGTTEAGSTVVLTVAGTDYPATVTGTEWSVTLPTSIIPEGETSLPVVATTTDAAGNSASEPGTIAIDTVTDVAILTNNAGPDNIVNEVEHDSGVVLNGTAEPGAVVNVTLGTVTNPATVAANGSWTVTFASADVPTGEQSVTITAHAIDAAGNEETASSTIAVDTLVRDFAITSTPGGDDGVINADEATSGLTVTGTTEPGGAVMLTLNGHSVPAAVAADGSWTAQFSASQLPSGETTTVLTAVSTDLAGNVESIDQNVIIDTDAGTLTISPTPVEDDDVVNFVEASDGVILTGTSDPGQWVDVTMHGVTHTVLTDATGTWVAPFAASEITPGTYEAQITATITDSAGNTLTRTDSVQIDTEVLNFATSTDKVEGDNVINADEASNGFTLTGTSEPGGTVTVTFGNASQTVNIGANGAWSVNFPASAIADGEYATSATVDTVDAAGNVASTTVDFAVDTHVNELEMDANPATDGVINAAEAAAGITLTGDVEPGSIVEVTLNNVVHTAVVDEFGGWSVDIPSSSIPTGTINDYPIYISATDAAGNTDTITRSVDIDTDAPDTLSWTGYGRTGGGIAQVWTEATEDTLFLGEVENAGGTPVISEVGHNNVTAGDNAYLFLDAPVPDGTHLVLASTDTAGNTSGAYLVTDDPATSDVQMSNDIASALRVYNIDTIDLHFAEDANLTLTEQQIAELSSTSDTVAIRGGSDDSVTLQGGVATGTHSEDGVNYNVFTVGDTTVLIEDDITNVSTVI